MKRSVAEISAASTCPASAIWVIDSGSSSSQQPKKMVSIGPRVPIRTACDEPMRRTADWSQLAGHGLHRDSFKQVIAGIEVLHGQHEKQIEAAATAVGRCVDAAK